MNRIVISILAGITLTFGTPIVAALALFPGDRTNAIAAFLLYWPVPLLEKLGLGPNCANADGIDEKLTCIHISLLIDLASYPLISGLCSYLIYVIVFRRGVRKRSQPTEGEVI